METSQRWPSLSELASGTVAQVKAIHAGHGLQGRLTAMGLHRGVHVRMIQNVGRGPLIVEVAGNRMVLGRGMAEKVYVHPLSARTTRPSSSEPESTKDGPGSGRS